MLGAASAFGSSPLTQGTSVRLSYGTVAARLIPARAGNTWVRKRRVEPQAAHPRLCGEHTRPAPRRVGFSGSSPLARGTHWVAAEVAGPAGLIPAREGNTGRLQKAVASRWAHPRSRGEHKVTPYAPCFCSGSSPLARGPRADGLADAALGGLIPARAGNTNVAQLKRYPTRAHPRSRGEHAEGFSTAQCCSGSSPLARGTRASCVSTERQIGLIPARAGNTRTRSASHSGRRAHPRSRGEHAGTFQTKSRETGSSPLARGTLLRRKRDDLSHGLIPARAGNTGSGFVARRWVSGSSPLARGTLV